MTGGITNGNNAFDSSGGSAYQSIRVAKYTIKGLEGAFNIRIKKKKLNYYKATTIQI